MTSFQRNGNSDRIGLDSYALHRHLAGEDKPSPERLRWFLDEVVRLELDGCQLDPAHLDYERDGLIDRLADMARERELYLELGMGGTDPQRMIDRLRAAQRAGARSLRTFVGYPRETWESRRGELTRQVVEQLSAAAQEAEVIGMPLAVENHGDLTGPELRDILEAVGSRWIGACVDFGNNVVFGEDPLETVRMLAPFAESVHVKDVVDDGGRPRSCLFGEGIVDIPAAVEILRREGRSHAPWTIEAPYEGPERGGAGREIEMEFVRENVRRFREILAGFRSDDEGGG